MCIFDSQQGKTANIPVATTDTTKANIAELTLTIMTLVLIIKTIYVVHHAVCLFTY